MKVSSHLAAIANALEEESSLGEIRKPLSENKAKPADLAGGDGIDPREIKPFRLGGENGERRICREADLVQRLWRERYGLLPSRVPHNPADSNSLRLQGYLGVGI